jgi:hypothetical protein
MLCNSFGLDSKNAWSNRSTLMSTGISSTAFSTAVFLSQDQNRQQNKNEYK